MILHTLAAWGYWAVFVYFWLQAHGLLVMFPTPLDEPPFRSTSPNVP